MTREDTVFEKLFQRAKYITFWMHKQLELVEAYSLRPIEDQGKPYVTKGEIYYAHLGNNIGSEIDKQRPVLIFQNNDRFIRQSNLAVIIPISSNNKVRPYRIPLRVNDIIDNQGITDSSIIVQQIRSISKARLSQLKGRLTAQKLEEVSGEVQRLFYKNTPLHVEGDAQTTGNGAAKNVE